MARKIIILDRQNLPSDQDFRVAFWLDVPPARQPFYANATAASGVIGATAGEVLAIQAGEVVETIETIGAVAEKGFETIESQIVAKHGKMQAAFDANNPWTRYGSSWDGVKWTSVRVA